MFISQALGKVISHLSWSLIVAVVVLTACAPAASPTPEPTPTRPLRPTFTPTVPPTDTPVPERPTPTPVDTPTLQPTDTPAEPPTPTPEPPTATPEAQPMAVISGANQVNTRSGPGTNYPVVGQASRGTSLEIVGRNPAGDWWQVCCVNGQQVWVVARLVSVEGNAEGVAVAESIPAPPPPTPRPTPRPAAPTDTPAPPPTPAPAYLFDKIEQVQPRPNSNPIITFFGLLLNQNRSGTVGGYLLVVDGPTGRAQGEFVPFEQRGDPGLPSEFIYNAKVEFLGTTEGSYRAFVADSGGNPVAEPFDFTVAGETRIFFPRWKQR